MAEIARPDEKVDWRLTTWEGAQREQLRRWAALPLVEIVRALEEMEDLAARLAAPQDKGAQRGSKQ